MVIAGGPTGPNDRTYPLVALLLYGACLRLLEGLRPRAKDVDFGRGHTHGRLERGPDVRTVPTPQIRNSPRPRST